MKVDVPLGSDSEEWEIEWLEELHYLIKQEIMSGYLYLWQLTS